ncbi:hypothetical protein ACFLRM_00790 [Acidobacteriota bacterium]
MEDRSIISIIAAFLMPGISSLRAYVEQDWINKRSEKPPRFIKTN